MIFIFERRKKDPRGVKLKPPAKELVVLTFQVLIKLLNAYQVLIQKYEYGFWSMIR